jgi:hypothetical protein
MMYSFDLDYTTFGNTDFQHLITHISLNFRIVYQTDKRLAETAKLIEKGECVQPKKTLSINHGIWLTTMGGGFGQKQYRFVNFQGFKVGFYLFTFLE